MRRQLLPLICLPGLALPACRSVSTGPGQSGSPAQSYSQIQSGEAEEGVPAIAAREMVRRQERVRRADEAALKANRYSAEGKHEEAIRGYRQALDSLPDSR